MIAEHDLLVGDHDGTIDEHAREVVEAALVIRGFDREGRSVDGVVRAFDLEARSHARALGTTNAWSGIHEREVGEHDDEVVKAVLLARELDREVRELDREVRELDGGAITTCGKAPCSAAASASAPGRTR